jgi:SAM-dependent methyltransferase
MAEYDAIGDRYSEAKQAPWRVHLEAYTLERLAGDVRGLRVLDLACGDGFYTRRFKCRGAAEAVGVDLSAEMVALGRRAEAAAPLGCRYHVGDAADVALGVFDLVVAAYLFNYAHDRAELARLCAAVAAHLRPGGRLVGVNDYTDDGLAGSRDLSAHGFRKAGPDPYVEGGAITYEFLLPEGRTFSITNYYWQPATYLAALREAGFSAAAWQPFELSPDAPPAAPGFWDDFRTAEPCAALHAGR